jgi:nitrate reductase NapE component
MKENPAKKKKKGFKKKNGPNKILVLVFRVWCLLGFGAL